MLLLGIINDLNSILFILLFILFYFIRTNIDKTGIICLKNFKYVNCRKKICYNRNQINFLINISIVIGN